jgi:hypothetical protein
MIPVTLSCDTGYSGQQYLVQPCTPVSSDPGNAHRTTRTTCCRTRFGSTSRMGRNGAVPSVEGHRAVRTPCRITASEFSDSLKHFLDACCVLRRDTLCCTICGASILYVRAALSIHDAACAGCEEPDQKVWNTVVPYCPRCEERPAQRGCLYLPLMVFSRGPEANSPRRAA